MNPILAYAVEHQAEARAIIVGYYGLRGDDVEDICQQVLVNIWQADPAESSKPRAYWWKVIKNLVITYSRRIRHLRLVESFEEDDPGAVIPTDPRQNPEIPLLVREQIQEAWEVATPAERQAIIDRLSQQRGEFSNSTKVYICRLKRKLRERASACR